MNEIEVGRDYEINYPFTRCKYLAYDGERNMVEHDGWKPGIEYEHNDNYGGSQAFADANGSMTLSVISIHKPGKYPERVFYTRKFKNPDGQEFGKGGLKITTTTNFKKLISGFMYEYAIAD